jgi:hypothetical protein
MTTYYRNRETGLVQPHPKSGIGESLNADEIGEDARPVKPRTSPAPAKAERKAAIDLTKDQSASPQTADSKSAIGDSNKQKGAE